MATDDTGTRSVHNTLTGTTVDTVTLQGSWRAVEIFNRDEPGSAPLWVTLGKKGDTLADPVAAANETFYIPAASSLIVEAPNGVHVEPQVKILGNGNDYSVVGLP